MKKCLLFVFLGAMSVYGRDVALEELQTSAYEHSQRIRMHRLDTMIETSRLKELYAGLYPQLSLNYNGEYNHNLDPSASGYLSVGGVTINSTIPYKHSAALGLN
ncbi:MAG: hypothetical protein AB7S65_07490 [Sulfuricurvum sp.]